MLCARSVTPRNTRNSLANMRLVRLARLHQLSKQRGCALVTRTGSSARIARGLAREVHGCPSLLVLHIELCATNGEKLNHLIGSSLRSAMESSLAIGIEGIDVRAMLQE